MNPKYDKVLELVEKYDSIHLIGIVVFVMVLSFVRAFHPDYNGGR